jgi:hypothetical protein
MSTYLPKSTSFVPAGTDLGVKLLSNNLPALAKNCNYLRGLRNVDNEISTTQVAAATYFNNQNELNISSNVGDGIRCQTLDNSDCFDSATVEAELLGTKSGLIGTVLGQAVAQSSWGKSGCECKCRFQINGGLHRSAREAPLDTESLQIPIWCHVNKSKSPSSTQTQVAAVAYFDKRNGFRVHLMKHHRTTHKRYLNADRKKTKQDESLGTKSGLIGTVLGHAAVWSSWGMSGCERKCRFQINGEIHCSSREAPLDKESLQVPIWCHVNKSKSPSSTQT